MQTLPLSECAMLLQGANNQMIVISCFFAKKHVKTCFHTLSFEDFLFGFCRGALDNIIIMVENGVNCSIGDYDQRTVKDRLFFCLNQL